MAGDGYGPGERLPAPGWYLDASGWLRWWDGRTWGPYAPPPPPPLRGPYASSARSVATLAHCSLFLGGFIIAVVLHTTADPADRWIRAHTAEALNYQLTLLVIFTPLAIVSFVLTIALGPAWFFVAYAVAVPASVVSLVWCIRAAQRAYHGGTWRYPLRFGFIATPPSDGPGTQSS